MSSDSLSVRFEVDYNETDTPEQFLEEVAPHHAGGGEGPVMELLAKRSKTKPRGPHAMWTRLKAGECVRHVLHMDSENVLDALCRVQKCSRHSI